ncbi:MAG: 3-methyl-2-oxobutanoate hydroxymethyltransferase [Betaproteobacteria bacterium]
MSQPSTPSATKVTLTTLQKMRASGEKIAMLTCYDASFAALMDEAGVDTLLIGDSMGMVVQGHATTLPVTIDHIAYHTDCVARGAKRAFLMADMPFGSYHTAQQALDTATVLMRAGAEMVKLEGGEWLLPTVQMLVQRGIPVCAHLGLTPQSVHQFGGFKVQAREDDAAQRLLADALALQAAGASLLVLEAIPAKLATEATNQLNIPTIGIGAGLDCSGQVLVMHDMLGAFPGRRPKFVRDFMQGQGSVSAAIRAFVDAVKQRAFPAAEHSF